MKLPLTLKKTDYYLCWQDSYGRKGSSSALSFEKAISEFQLAIKSDKSLKFWIESIELTTNHRSRIRNSDLILQ